MNKNEKLEKVVKLLEIDQLAEHVVENIKMQVKDVQNLESSKLVDNFKQYIIENASDEEVDLALKYLDSNAYVVFRKASELMVPRLDDIINE